MIKEFDEKIKALEKKVRQLKKENTECLRVVNSFCWKTSKEDRVKVVKIDPSDFNNLISIMQDFKESLSQINP